MSYLTQALNFQQVSERKEPKKDFEAIFKLALEEINSKYISGTIPYIKGTHPHLWQRLIEVENNLSEAWLRGLDDEFKRNLDDWTDLNLKAIEIFQERDTQGGLFEHGGH